jgi:hypothetical protein
MHCWKYSVYMSALSQRFPILASLKSKCFALKQREAKNGTIYKGRQRNPKHYLLWRYISAKQDARNSENLSLNHWTQKTNQTQKHDFLCPLWYFFVAPLNFNVQLGLKHSYEKFPGISNFLYMTVIVCVHLTYKFETTYFLWLYVQQMTGHFISYPCA